MYKEIIHKYLTFKNKPTVLHSLYGVVWMYLLEEWQQVMLLASRKKKQISLPSYIIT